MVTIRDRIAKDGELPISENVWSLKRANMKVIALAEVDHFERVARLIQRGIDDKSIRTCNVPLMTRMLFSALRSVPGHYLGVRREMWPELDKEVLIAIRRFLSA